MASSKQQSAQVRGKIYERFNQVLDRVFGNDAVSKQKYGGWLDYCAGSGAAPTGASSGPTGTNATASAAAAASKKQSKPTPRSLIADDELDTFINSLQPNARAVARLLGTGMDDENGSILQFLFRVAHPVEFKLELDLLPEQSKMSILGRSPATSALFTQLLHKPLIKQVIDPRSPALLVSIQELFLFYLLRYPSSASHQSSPSYSGTSSSSTAGSVPYPVTGSASSLLGGSPATGASSIMGSISSSFVKPKGKAEHSWRMFFHNGVASLVKGNPYNVLLLQYLRGFLPDSNKPVKSRFHAKMVQSSNVFLHALIEFWLRQNLIVFTDDPIAPAAGAPSIMSPISLGVKLASPFAAVHTYTSYMAPSDDLLSSLLLTIIHVLSDSFYPAPLAEEAATSTPGSYNIGHGGGLSGGHGAVGGAGACLTPSVTVLRRPLYEFLRLVFSRAPIGLSPTAFLAITDVWLAYIQPWCCRRWADVKTSGVLPPQTKAEGYTPEWESYVLANYHFYTTLLGVFVERARELDFSGADERTLSLLDRVLSVYNAELLALLRRANRFFEKAQPFAVPFTRSNSSNNLYAGTHSGANLRNKPRPSTTDRDDSLSQAQGQVLSLYCKTLGVDSVPVPLHDSFHRDAERLFDKLWASAPLSGATSSSSSKKPTKESLLETLQRLSRMMRVVFEISDAYVASTAHARPAGPGFTDADGLESLEPSRYLRFSHLLTRRGVQQIKRGLRLCSPDAARFVGDPMLRPICSFEIPFLVRLSYRISTWLNAQLGLESPYRGKRFEDNVDIDPSLADFGSFRFNLRFLASKVNLSFLAAFLLLVYVVYAW